MAENKEVNKIWTLEGHDVYGYELVEDDSGKIDTLDPLHELDNFENVIINQETNYEEGCLSCFGCCCLDFTNRYDIYYGNDKIDGRPMNLLVNEIDSWCCYKILCNPNHELKLKVSSTKNGREQDVMEIVKPFKCCCPAVLPCFQREATIYRIRGSDRWEIGYIEQPWMAGGCRPDLDIFDKRNGAFVGRISGPCCCIGGQLCSSDWNFQNERGERHAEIIADGEWEKGVVQTFLKHANRYELSFETGRHTQQHKHSVDEKLRIIASTLFMDYLFFEGLPECVCVLFNCENCLPHFECPPQCWFKICDLYCCGALFPMYCKCCLKEAVGAATSAATGGMSNEVSRLL